MKIGSLKIGIDVHLYIRRDPTGVMEKLKPGQTLLATGTANDCHISVKGAPRLYLHIDTSSIALAPK